MKYVVFKTYIDLANRVYRNQILGNSKDQRSAGPCCLNIKAICFYRDTLRVGGICTRAGRSEREREEPEEAK